MRISTFVKTSLLVSTFLSSVACFGRFPGSNGFAGNSGILPGFPVNGFAGIGDKFQSPPDFVKQFIPKFQNAELRSSDLSYQHRLHHFVFVLDWPGTWVSWGKGEVDVSLNISWVISGMWPERHGRDQDSPMYCDKNYLFDMKELLDIEGDLNLAWPFLGHRGRKTNEQQWRYEWLKYGTCALKSPNMHSEFDYFSGSLLMHYNFPVYDWLDEAGIIPDTFKAYKKSDIVKAIYKRIHKRPFLRCVKEQNKSFLKSIMICVDLNLNPIDCTHWNSESHEHLCRKERIWYPKMPEI